MYYLKYRDCGVLQRGLVAINRPVDGHEALLQCPVYTVLLAYISFYICTA
jgi:hypothetical protein